MQKEEQVSFLAEKIRQADAVLIGGGRQHDCESVVCYSFS